MVLLSFFFLFPVCLSDDNHCINVYHMEPGIHAHSLDSTISDWKHAYGSTLRLPTERFRMA
jgi:hypothetical protein